MHLLDLRLPFFERAPTVTGGHGSAPADFVIVQDPAGDQVARA